VASFASAIYTSSLCEEAFAVEFEALTLLAATTLRDFIDKINLFNLNLHLGQHKIFIFIFFPFIVFIINSS
jgi:hypothetical protein